MKMYFLIPFTAIFLSSCNQNSESTEIKDLTEEQKSIGGNKDENGCYTSAGFRWSELRNDCIQLFKDGQRLNPVDIKEDEAIISSFIIVSPDHSKAELFIGNEQLILPKADEYSFEKGIYRYDYKKCLLYIDGKKAYEIE